MKTFKRKPTIGLTTLVFVAIFIYYGLSYTEYELIPPVVKLTSAGLAFIYAIWQLTTPYVIIDETNVIIKSGIFSTNSIEINQIDNFNVLDDEIELRSGLDTFKIKFRVLGNEGIASLSEEINKIKQKDK